jgi:tetratricopeptide (TPR) repeat protein
MLKDAFHATSREGRARLVSVTGPAGIGKSRLAWEFEKYLDGVVETVWWHHGRSPAYGQGVTFWALGEMVRARCGLAESADEQTTRARVHEMLATHLPDVSEQAWVRPAILALLGVEAERVAAEELFARWRLLFERLSATGTVVLVFEDLHWADPATMDFIDHLLDWSKSLPILVVTLARPELLDQRADWGAGRRTFVALALDPLPDPAMRKLLAGLVPGLPADAASRIVARAEGIPLYAVETIRMLVADKRLVLDGQVYIPVGDVSDLAVPETLTGLIAARLDALDPQDRTLVLDAAVLGQSFTREALCAISGFPSDELERRLRMLVRRELFTLEADPRSPERGQYAFVQAMIREVAYNTLAKRDRKERHLTAARFFEGLGSDELAGALAGHYLSAYENAPEGPEADTLAAQARVALRGAAERAYALASFHQAVHLLEQALRVTTDPVDRAATLERMGTAAGMTGRHGEAIGYLEEALAVAHAAASPSVVARITLELGRSNVEAGHMDAAIALLADESVAAGADREVAIAIRSQLARAWMMRPDHPKALVIADEVLAEADPAGMWAIFVDTLVTKASAFHMLGRPHEGIALLEAALSLAIEHDQLNARFRALYNLAGALAKIDFARGLARTLEGLELARRLGIPYWEHAFVGNVALQAMQTGDWDLALRELDRAEDETYEGSDRLLVLVGRIQARSFRREDVSAELAEVRRIVAEDPNDFFRGALTEVIVDTEWNAGDYVASARAAEDLVKVRPDYEPTARMTAARAWLWAGRLDEAIVHLRALEDVPPQPITSQVRIDAVQAVYRLVRGEQAAMDDLLDAIDMMHRAHLELDAVLVSVDAGRFGDPGDPRVAATLDAVTAFADRTGAVVLADLATSLRRRTGAEVGNDDPRVGQPRPAAG